MTRRPSATRTLHQLERHGRGTPNDPPAPVPSWAHGLAALKAGTPTLAQAMANIGLWQDTLRSKSAAS